MQTVVCMLADILSSGVRMHSSLVRIEFVLTIWCFLPKLLGE